LDHSIETFAKIRYQFTPAPCTVIPLSEDQVQIVFKTPQRAITPGQSVVFYQDDLVLGGGIIDLVDDL
jgi:tRNA-specific 2-thiouridylase